MQDSEGKPTSKADEILAANKKLGEQIDALNTKIGNVDKRGERTRWGVYILSAIIAIALVIGGAKKIHDVNDRVDSAVNYDVQSCTASNATRAEAKSLWDSVVQLLTPEGKKPSPGLASFTAALQAKVNKVYAQRDCAQVKNGSPAPAILPIPAPTKK